MALSHAQIWSALDALARRFGLSPSALARLAGLDPTSFNKSKRMSGDSPPRPRWPSTESLAKVLAATGVGFAEFAAMADPRSVPKPRGLPLIGLAQAAEPGLFDEAGFPVGEGWDEMEAPWSGEGLYALEINGDDLAPFYRPGDRIVVDPSADPRRGDRVVLKTADGEVFAAELARLTSTRVELRSPDPGGAGRTLDRRKVLWIARIVWASQ